MISAAIIAYASVAYWLFWLQLGYDRDSRTIILIRSALYLIGGPIGLAMIYVAAALAIAADKWSHRQR